MYYEADCKVEKRPKANCLPYNRVTLGFDHLPDGWHEIKAELAKRYPELELIKVLRVWDASAKAKDLAAYYNNGHQFHGD